MSPDRYHYEDEIQGLQRSIANTSRPIRRLHIFDFDSTLFRSPLPNRELWSDPLRGALVSDCGWFQEPRTLLPPYVPLNPGPRWWHEETIRAAADAFERHEDTVTVLLTGRRRDRFGDRIRSMCLSRDPPLAFDLFCLREGCEGSPEQGSRLHATTLDFKLAVLKGLVEAFPNLIEVELWDDRARHLELFSATFATWKEAGQLCRFQVHHVAHFDRDALAMPEELETQLVKELVAVCNGRIMAARHRENANGDGGASPNIRRRMQRRTSASLFRDLLELAPEVRYTGILLDEQSQAALLSRFPAPGPQWDPKCHHLTVCLGAAKAALVDPLGGLGARVAFSAVSFGEIPQVVSAVLAAAHPPSSAPLSENTSPHVTLYVAPGAKAVQSNTIESWTPIDPPIPLAGILAEKHVTGLKAEKQAPQRKKDISIGELVKKHHPDLVGRDLGKAVRIVEQWMEKTFIENLGQNRANVEWYVQNMELGKVQVAEDTNGAAQAIPSAQ